MGKNLFLPLWRDEILQNARKRASGNASSGNCKWSAIPPWRGIGQTGGRTQPSNQLSHPWPATIAADVRFNKGIQFRITWGRRSRGGLLFPLRNEFSFQIFHVQSYRHAGLYAHGSYTAQWALHQTTFPSIDS